jgi:hypothetical protein
MMNIDHPSALWLIPASLSLVALAVWGWSARKELAFIFRLDTVRMKRKQAAKYVIAFMLVALLAVALASPRLPFSVLPLPSKTGEIALLVDVSRSMGARRDPGSPSSLERVKPILQDIVNHLQELGGVRIALYGFTNMARSHVPFVGRQDYPYLRASIERVLDINSTPGSGSGFGRPILDVSSKFSRNAKMKLIVLFSDGEPFVGVSRGIQGTERALLEQAMTKLRLERIRVITVGIGELRGAKIPVYDEKGSFKGEYARLHDADLRFYLAGEVLREIAVRTGGRYYGESDRSSLIALIKESFDSAPFEEITEKATEFRSISRWLVLVAFPLWVLLARRFLLG